MFERLWKAISRKGGDRIVKIVKGPVLDRPDGPAWQATAYGPSRPCPMCGESGRRVREVQDGIWWETRGHRRFEPTGSDVQCDCGIRWGDDARLK